ncbi:MAG TPA: non-ribosomal peptide synthetase [bacterium]|nr:non-ribosomal peptide synthetase [bacterium]
MEDVEQTISSRFEQQVAQCPDRIAVKTRTAGLTYAHLNRAANEVAWTVMAQRGAAQEPVALLFEHGAPFIIASLGVIKAGRIQVPLESSFPRPRLQYMLEHAGATTLVTDNANLALARELAAPSVINIDELDHRGSAPNLELDLRPETTVAINYTSGSTGQPKGIVWNHRGVLHAVMRHTNTYRVCAHDRIVGFRASLRPHLYALLNGAACYPVACPQQDPVGLVDWMTREEITVYRAAVSTFRSFAGALRGVERFPHLRLILLYGEPVYRADVELSQRHFPRDCLLGSSLGCSEFDDYACCFIDSQTPLTGAGIPGAALMANAEVLLLDEDGRPVGADQVGEIVIRSRYNALGYWRRDDLTQAAFRPDPADSAGSRYFTGDLGRRGRDGRLSFVGRKDFQVKIRGHRVDTTEVEAVLLGMKSVEACAVVTREQAPGDTRLVAYIVPAALHSPTVGDLRRHLGETLPDYMVPSVFVRVEALPLTATGKVDRRALPPPGRARPSLDAPFAAPRTALEERLAAIWADVLALDEVGVNDDFWALGGNSLLAIRVLARVLAEFQVELPLRSVFDAPTVPEMALQIVRGRMGRLRSEDAVASGGGDAGALEAP